MCHKQRCSDSFPGYVTQNEIKTIGPRFYQIEIIAANTSSRLVRKCNFPPRYTAACLWQQTPLDTARKLQITIKTGLCSSTHSVLRRVHLSALIQRLRVSH